jgi:hypothetical protein
MTTSDEKSALPPCPRWKREPHLPFPRGCGSLMHHVTQSNSYWDM